MTLLATIEAWASDASQLATDAVPVINVASNALAAISNAAKMFTAFQGYMQTPQMLQASEAEKLAAFHAHVQNAIQSGSEGELEELESDSP